MVAVAEGSVKAEEVRQFLDLLVADPETDHCDELIVLRGLNLRDVTSAEVRGIARHASDVTQNEEFRTAVVAADDADFGLLRMFEVFRGRPDGQLMVFREIEEACKWLGVDPSASWLDE